MPHTEVCQHHESVENVDCELVVGLGPVHARLTDLVARHIVHPADAKLDAAVHGVPLQRSEALGQQPDHLALLHARGDDAAVGDLAGQRREALQ